MTGPTGPAGDAGATPGTASFDLAGYLRARGVDPAVVADAEATGSPALRRLAPSVVLLGAPPTLTPADVWERAGADEALARELWAAMGFAQIPSDAPALTDADVEALAAIHRYLQATGVEAATAVRFTRLLGQTMSRVADALLSIVDEGIHQMDHLPGGETEDLMVIAAEVVNPLIEHELSYLFRRHLYAGALRRLDDHDLFHSDQAVGFADVVQFTRLSGQLPESAISELVEWFETLTSAEIAEHGGRVVKLIGDAVLFEFDDAAAAARCALHLAGHEDADRPHIRVGMAHGEVISRLGDIFGPTVNLASRLVGYARPGTVVVDGAFVGALGDDPAFDIRSLRPRELKGIGPTELFVVRLRG